MTVGIIVSTNDAETCWVALRYATFHLMQHDEVKVFFVDSGRGYRQIASSKFNISEGVEKFRQAGGLVFVCDSRGKLEEYLKKYFVPFISHEEAVDIITDDRFRSVRTCSAYIRNFRKVC
jgi:hypothetical protein